MSRTRHFLRSVFTRPGVVVRGYDSEGLFELDPTTRPHVVVGRSSATNGISIGALIGGRRTAHVTHDEGRWWFSVANEWAMIRLDGRMLRRGGRTALDAGAQLELLALNTGEVVHTLAYELREDPDEYGP